MIVTFSNAVGQALQYPFMINALEAGTLVALAAGVVGWFVVLRQQAFASHTLAAVGFPGASGAVLFGLPLWVGYFGFSVAAAIIIAVASRRQSASLTSTSTESAVVGTVLALSLACGYFFVSLYRGNIQGVSALLFGNFLGVSQSQVAILAVATLLVLVVLGLISRPLFFASVDPEVARVGGVAVGRIGVVFLVLLGVTAAEAGQITGALLVFSLVVLPAATAQALVVCPSWSVFLTVVLGTTMTWLGLGLAYATDLPIGACITTLGFAAFVLARAKQWLEARAVRRSRARLGVRTAAAAQ